MGGIKWIVVVGLLGPTIGVALTVEATAQARRTSCGGGHRLSVVDLDIAPDPISAGQPLQTLKVVLQVDGNGECDTVLQVKEKRGGEVVSLSLQKVLRPGRNPLVFRAAQGYKFQPRDQCFVVSADVAGTQRVDATREFCARYIPPSGSGHWTMAEGRSDRASDGGKSRQRSKDRGN